MSLAHRRILQAIVIFGMGIFVATGNAILQGSPQAAESQGFTITSPAFANDAKIPSTFTCSGDNQSPPLTWRDAPARTRSYLLILRDPDAPSGEFIHWVAFDIPGSTHKLEQGISRSGPPPQGTNGFGRIGYDGPCPPPGRVHHYKFELTALDATLNLRPGASAKEVESKAFAHRLATTELSGEFAR
ncbi:MAG TPA: YbhB/YbcL family Raf kinase inhibitor-like protein [Candidatus Binataceae bacterium]|jgi:Raf kinase inhibitor-like YbhB/YbcL family protein|nr:YbhB/YbcL family Raf kinase inhibitor-like protein [Candidatus Binataceae bacterium]